MVARQRALLLADGKLRFDPDIYHADEDVPWEGVERTHPNDDRRPPLLWIAGGLRSDVGGSARPFLEAPHGGGWGQATFIVPNYLHR